MEEQQPRARGVHGPAKEMGGPWSAGYEEANAVQDWHVDQGVAVEYKLGFVCTRALQMAQRVVTISLSSIVSFAFGTQINEER
ncbi:hypothetical protein H6P81_010048 [Aristolochia fimbriata]|uniref:Uncharacterized protein n=1 Tax=Aristolochia fimbriata TaxID=158543 RepID=A0AAV7EMM7_ARIFI|nr:hypothetical protein H6P81_010048 [Aristolochia fimbriata]